MPRRTAEKSSPEPDLPRRIASSATERAGARLQRLLPRVHETFALSRRVDGLAAAVVTRRAVADLVALEVPAFSAETELGTLTWTPAPEAFDLDEARARRGDS